MFSMFKPVLRADTLLGAIEAKKNFKKAFDRYSHISTKLLKKFNETALMKAAKEQNIEAIQWLLLAKEEHRGHEAKPGLADKNGHTALHFAADCKDAGGPTNDEKLINARNCFKLIEFHFPWSSGRQALTEKLAFLDYALSKENVWCASFLLNDYLKNDFQEDADFGDTRFLFKMTCLLAKAAEKFSSQAARVEIQRLLVEGILNLRIITPKFLTDFSKEIPARSKEIEDYKNKQQREMIENQLDDHSVQLESPNGTTVDNYSSDGRYLGKFRK